MEKVCRLCLREYFDLTSVFLIKQGRRVTNMIKDVVPEIRIERDDNHSKLICSECLEVVCSAFELRTVSIKNAKRMGSLVDSPRGSYMSGGSKEAGRSAPQSEPCRTNVGNVIATKAQTTIRRNFQIKPLSIILKRVDVDFEAGSSVKVEPTESQNISSANVHQPEPGEILTEPKLVCYYCKVAFNGPLVLSNHIRNEHSDICKIVNIKPPKKKADEVPAAFKCHVCNRKFDSSSALAVHDKRHKLPSNIIQCEECDEKFETREHLKLHKFIHEGYVEEFDDSEQTFACSVCAFQSKISADVHEHLAIHQDDINSNKFLVCLRCNVTFKSFDDLVEHTDQHNKKVTHRCLKCGKKFPYGQKLVNHLRRYKESYVCDMCGLLEPGKQRIEDHIRVVHMKQVCFLCPMCGETKTSRETLRSHIITKHEDFERPYKCTQCPRSFRTPASYRNHQAVHETVAVRISNISQFKFF